MADEIIVNFNGTVTNGNFKHTFPPKRNSIDQADVGGGFYIQALTTAEEALSFPADVATEGCMYLENLDSTNAITYGPESGGAQVDFGQLKAGEFAWLRIEPGITMRAKAAAGTADLYWFLLED